MVLDVLRMVLVVAQSFLATKSAACATVRLKSHMAIQGRADRTAFYTNFN